MALNDVKEFSSNKFIDAFGKEFSKHEVLWKSQHHWDENKIQVAKDKAYSAMAKNLDLPVEKVIELLNMFPTICVDLAKKKKTSKYSKKSDPNAVRNISKELVPKWLMLLMMNSDLFKTVKKNKPINKVSKVGYQDILIRELCLSAEGALYLENGRKGDVLRGSRAVKLFVDKHGLRVSDVLPVWQGVYKMCILKLKALMDLSHHTLDVPETLRLNEYEWKVVDLALLYNRGLKLVNLSQLSTGRKHSSLILLYKLIVAARKVYDKQKLKLNSNSIDESITKLITLLCNGNVKIDEDKQFEAINNPNTLIQPNSVINLVSGNKSGVVRLFKSQTKGLQPMEKGVGNKWYGNSQAQKFVWALVYTEFIKRGRIGSLIYLQRRWLELLHQAYTTLFNMLNLSDQELWVHPILVLLVHRFPEIITEDLPIWRHLVDERLYVAASDVEDFIKRFMENDKPLLDVDDHLSDSDFVKEFYKKELNHFNIKLNKRRVNVNEKKSESDDVHSDVTHILQTIDPTKAKVTIIFEDSDDDVQDCTDICENNDNSSVCTRENQLPHSTTVEEPKQYSDKYDVHTLKTINDIENEFKDKCNYIKNTVATSSELNNSENNCLDETNANEDVLSQSENDSMLEPVKEMTVENFSRENTPEIDEKLFGMCNVVLTPIEHSKEWKKFSRDGSIKCTRFSVSNFLKPVVSSKQLEECRPYKNKNKDHDQDIENTNSIGFRIKFEDDEIFQDICTQTISDQKRKELNNMPYETRINRIKLTRRLKLSRTYYTSNFWRIKSNIELMRKCKPLYVNLNKYSSRIKKKFELPNMNVRTSISTTQAIASTISTNTCDTTSTRDAMNLKINNSYVNIQNNNSLSSYFSEELRILLTNSATKKDEKNSNSNLMDSIIDNLRLNENNPDSAKTLFSSKPMLGLFHGNVIKNNSSLTARLSSLKAPKNSILDSSTSTSSNVLTVESSKSFNLSNSESSNLSNLRSSNFPPLESSNLTSSNFSTLQSSNHPNSPPNLNENQFKPNNRKALKTMSLSECLKEIFKNDTKSMENVYFYKKTIWLKPDDVEKMVRDFAEKSELLEYLDDKQRIRKLLKLHEYRVLKHEKELYKDMIYLTKFLPQYISIVTKRKRKIKKKPISKDSDKHWENNYTNEPALVIDESNKESNNDNSSREPVDVNKNSAKSTEDDKQKKRRKKTRRMSNNDEEKPLIDEYQEWQRQKTISLKYFTIPAANTRTKHTRHKQSSDKNEQTDKPNKKNQSTSTEQIAKVDDAILISDSDSDVQINGGDVIRPETNDKPTQTDAKAVTVDDNGSTARFDPAANVQTKPLYIIVNNNSDTNIQTQVHNGTVFAVHPIAITTDPRDIVNNAQYIPLPSYNDVMKDNKIDGSTSRRGVDESRQNYSTSDLEQPSIYPPDVSAISLEHFLSDRRDRIRPLIKVDNAKRLLCFLTKYIVLTKVNLPGNEPTYRTGGFKDVPCLTRVMLPRYEGVLLLGKKNVHDFMVCSCVEGLETKCKLCSAMDKCEGFKSNMIKVDNHMFKKVSDLPLEYVRVSVADLRTASTRLLDGTPDIILLNQTFFKKLSNSPLMYTRFVSAVPDVTTLRQLVANDVDLYWLDISTPIGHCTPILYRKSGGDIIITHKDPHLREVWTRIVNKK